MAFREPIGLTTVPSSPSVRTPMTSNNQTQQLGFTNPRQHVSNY